VLPTSDNLEAFYDRVKAVNGSLGRMKGAEVTKQAVLEDLRLLAKEWLRWSDPLRRTEHFEPQALDSFDDAWRAVLQSTNLRTRSSAYQKRLKPVIDRFVADVVIRLIKYEGSPAQVAARQLTSVFTGIVTLDENGYIDEAARCLTLRCHRASIIMLWAAAMARFHRAVESAGFAAYNAAVDQTVIKKANPFSRVSKHSISSLPELQRVRDFDIIVVGMALWGYDLQTAEQLERLLGIRNSAAHPGMLQPGALDVQQFATSVGQYVFALVKS
jgi:hypothetical protein